MLSPTSAALAVAVWVASLFRPLAELLPVQLLERVDLRPDSVLVHQAAAAPSPTTCRRRRPVPSPPRDARRPRRSSRPGRPSHRIIATAFCRPWRRRPAASAVVRTLQSRYLCLRGLAPFGQRPTCVKRIRSGQARLGVLAAAAPGCGLRPAPAPRSVSFAPAISARVGKKSMWAASAVDIAPAESCPASARTRRRACRPARA